MVQALSHAYQLEEQGRTFLEASALVDVGWPKDLQASWAPLSAKDMQPLVLTPHRSEWRGVQALHTRSNFAAFHADLGDESTSWVQSVTWNPPLGEDRDFEALRTYMGPTQSLAWLADVLQGKRVSEGGGSWEDEDDKPSGPEARKRTFIEDRPAND